MLQSNHFAYRAELLCDYLDADPNSERFKVIADAFAREMESAFYAMVVETAEAYQITDKTLAGLQRLQPDMMEVRLLQRLDQDPTSWLNQLRLSNKGSGSTAQGSVQDGLISSDMRGSLIATPISTEKDKDWYVAVLQQWGALIALVRQSSVHE
jgi:hypothetical protein